MTALRDAQNASRAKSEFLARTSHELRTPLHAILGFGQVLEMGELGDDARAGVGQITAAARHLLELTDGLLDISLIETGELAFALEPICAADVIREAVTMMRPLAREHSVTLVDETDAGDARRVMADRRRLKQVVINLLANGVKYNHPGGEVRAGCTAAGAGRLRLVVADTGPGIAPGDLDRLFLPFDRLGRESPSVAGMGLGLALSKGLIDAMHGEIAVESEPGAGSEFSVELPIAAAARHRAAGHAPRTVLYIEDNLSSVSLVRAVFKQRPFATLMTAAGGEVGLELAIDYRPDLVLLDLNLPDVHGADVLRRLRADARTHDTPVIVLSADASGGEIERLKGLGATDYLAKPFDVAQLLRIVDGLAPEGPAATATPSDAPLDETFLTELMRLCAGQPDGLNQLVRMFLVSGQQRVDELKSAALAGNLERVADLAHSLIGSSCTVGALHLAEASRALEHQARGAGGVDQLVSTAEHAHRRAHLALVERFPAA